jgi:hypothetical protein
MISNKRDGTLFAFLWALLNYEVYSGGGVYALCVLYSIAFAWFCSIIDESQKRDFVYYYSSVNRKHE